MVQPPVIVVPGITASNLDDFYPLPPEAVWSAVLKKKYDRLALHPENPLYEVKEPARVRAVSIFELVYEDLVEALRDEVREEAQNSVKATFIVDALAKKEEVNVDDQEVSQAIYYEAMMSGQDPQQVIKYYQENNLLPAVKMGMIEDKLFGKLLGLDK